MDEENIERSETIETQSEPAVEQQPSPVQVPSTPSTPAAPASPRAAAPVPSGSNSPVCHLVYAESGQGTFLCQWKASEAEEVNGSVMMFSPTKTVPKFKLTSNCGRSELSKSVVPDKSKFYSCLCQFVKMARDYNGKIQLLEAWQDRMPYNSDMYLHTPENKIIKIEKGWYDVLEADGVAAVARGKVASATYTLLASLIFDVACKKWGKIDMEIWGAAAMQKVN
ncbi:Immune mapped protein 2 [Babesia duncani]|uniref:Immune mapped protein 2 n=1 Tax=Babesia duncani TaxID=323732 RepID=A0AAD9PLU6_9APIC|nr:Immune mapped protein 2 [Babesia duncani]